MVLFHMSSLNFIDHPIAYPVLIGDIGGTNARFGILSDAHAEVKSFEIAKAANYTTIIEAIEEMVLAKTALRPRTAVLAIACPIDAEIVTLTNSHWVVNPKQMMQELDLADIVLLNDFEALALSLPFMEDDDLENLSGNIPPHAGTKLVIGPGTGLGAAGLIHAADTWVPVPGEGGHISIGPVTANEISVWPFLQTPVTPISAEHLVSGAGLLRLYQAISRMHGTDVICQTPQDVTTAAIDGNAGALEAMELFCTILGRVAGDLALVFMAKGGVYIAGGVSGHILEFLHKSMFVDAFCQKPPHVELLKAIDIVVITHPAPAFLGIASFARMPTMFGVNLGGRRWVSEKP
ncbi:MAG: glucokinase [Hyphomicrobiales bacterium]|nr:MAG: glucokinase [Hyphomicrobiales bacterium]